MSPFELIDWPCPSAEGGTHEEMALVFDRGRAQRVLVLPLTLFSGTLFPLEQLPVFLRPIGWLSPLWHGAELGRVTSYAAERPAWMIAVHLVFLLALAIGGWRLTVRVTRKRLDA